jgi:hypothetical protein
MINMENKKVRVWYIELDEDGNEIGRGVDDREYSYPNCAYRRAREVYGDRKRFKYIIAPRDPWIEYSRSMTCGLCGSGYSAPESYAGWESSDRLWLYRYGENGYRDKNKSFSGDICPECADKVAAFIKKLKKGVVDECQLKIEELI